MAPEILGGVTEATQLVSNKARDMGFIVKSGGKMGELAEKYWFVQKRGRSENKLDLLIS